MIVTIVTTTILRNFKINRFQKSNPVSIITYNGNYFRYFLHFFHFHLLGKQYSNSRLSSIFYFYLLLSLFLPFIINKRWYKEVHFVDLDLSTCSPLPSTFLLQPQGYSYSTICVLHRELGVPLTGWKSITNLK